MWKVTLAIWGSTAIAIVIALYYTHDMRCLWFLLIPACMRIRSNDEKSDPKESGEN
jgi:hypothetical protein